MVTSDRIHPGCRVIGSHGPLVASSNGGKRRVREKVYGTILKAVDQQRWEVMFDFDNRTQLVTSRSLKLVKLSAGIPLNELSEKSVSTLEYNFVRKH